MTLDSIIGISGAGVVVIILGLIKIKPLEISIWSWLFRKIGKSFNGELFDEINDIKKELNDNIVEEKRREALRLRTVILRFADEMYERDRYHSRDHFEEIIECIDSYEAYCEEDKDFNKGNGKTKSAEKIIREKYEECLKRGSFESSVNNSKNTK